MGRVTVDPPSTTPRRIPEVWWKTGLALATLVVCEVGARIVAPGLNSQALRDFLHGGSGGVMLRLYDWVVGGALSRGAVLGLGIMPYISARIWIRIARAVSPRLAAMWKTETGHAKLARWTRWLTGSLALLQSIDFVLFIERIPGVVANPGFGFLARTAAVMTSGSIAVMLLTERLLRRDDDDDSPPATEHTAAVAAEPPRSLEQSAPAERLLTEGAIPEREFYRPRGNRAGVPRSPADANRTND